MTNYNDVESNRGPKCPYCGNVHSDLGDYRNVVSYWGTDGTLFEFDCSECGLVFKVNEVVHRYWESTPIMQPKALGNK